MKKEQKEKKPNEKKAEKKDDVKSTIIALLIVLVLVAGGIIAYRMINAPPAPIVEEYNGYKFAQDQFGYWNVMIRTVRGDQIMPFYYHPSELTGYQYDRLINTKLLEVQQRGGIVTIVFDSKFADPSLTDVESPAIAGVELGKITSKVLGMQTVSAFNQEIPGATNLTIANCSNANPFNFVFYFKMADPNGSNRVTSQGYCATMQVTEMNKTIELADLVAYKLIGVMPNR